MPDIAGNPDIFQVECHASSAHGMKSTKVMNRPAGGFVQVTTRELGTDKHIGMGDARIVAPDRNGVIETNQ